MNFNAAQNEMRRAYVNGGIGVLVSGIVWVIAGLVTQNISFQFGMVALFFGGMAIHPVAVLIERVAYKRNKVTAPNPMEMLALQTTPILFVGLFAGFLVSKDNPDWFFGIALLAVGARYLIFQTIYGMRHYAVLGFALIAVGFAAIWFVKMAPHLVAITGGVAELFFSIAILRRTESVS
jgi:hypothetical protein